MLELFNMLVTFIKDAEATAPAGTKGAEKLEIVNAAVQAYAPLVGVSVAFITAIEPLISRFVAKVVAKFNNDGTFKKADAPAAVAPAAAPAV